MAGKKNVVFGFLYLVLTALLGPYMVLSLMGSVRQAEEVNTSAMEQLTRKVEGSVGVPDPQADSEAILALNQKLKAEEPINRIKSGPHAHGNLEALLNIVVGIVLGFLAVGRIGKEMKGMVFKVSGS